MNDINRFIQTKDLTREESYALFAHMPHFSMMQQADILSALTKKTITKDLILGAMNALLEHSLLIEYPDQVLDMVGTGGDGLRTFNISTAASLVVASCGVTVAKHGGKRVTSLSGSTDVIGALGIPMPKNADDCFSCLQTHRFAYLSAPIFNPLLADFSEVRQYLGVPTVLNFLGPLINPLRPKRQLLGVSQPHLLMTMAQVLKASGLHHAWVVHSDDGMDELSLSAPSTIIELREGLITTFRITPEDAGLKAAPLQSIIGGNSTENAQMIREMFSGNIDDAKLDIVLLNSAAGLLIAQRVSTLKEGVAMARSAIQSGQTLTFLNKLQGALL